MATDIGGMFEGWNASDVWWRPETGSQKSCMEEWLVQEKNEQVQKIDRCGCNATSHKRNTQAEINHVNSSEKFDILLKWTEASKGV